MKSCAITHRCIRKHDANKVEMDVHEDDREPLNGIYKPSEEGVQEDIAEQQDDANVPLTV